MRKRSNGAVKIFSKHSSSNKNCRKRNSANLNETDSKQSNCKSKCGGTKRPNESRLRTFAATVMDIRRDSDTGAAA